MESASVISEKPEPSLLRQIVDSADELDDAGKEEILWQIKMQKALAMAKTIDEKYAGMWKEMTEDEIAEMVSENRRKWYEEEIRG
jgi:hypothetical protein